MYACRWILIVLCLAACSGARAETEATPSPELEVMAHLPLPGPCSNLWAHRNVVYVGSFDGAKVGVKLIDISEPTQPTLISTLPIRPATFYHDTVAISADTPSFKGDLLALGLVSESNSHAGVEFWEVTDPRQPRLLGHLRTGKHGVHSLALVQREGRLLALLAHPDRGLLIAEATDPVQPRLLATWSLQKELAIDPGLGVVQDSFLHSVSANLEGTTAYLGYRDAGAVLLDITHPGQPRFLGRTVYPVTEEGGTNHTADAAEGGLLVTTDADWDPTPAANTIRITAPASLAGLQVGVELGFTRQLADSGPIQEEVVYVGSGSPGAAFLVDPKGKIALMDSTSGRSKVLRAQAAGATAVLFSRLQFREEGRDEKITIPGVSVKKETGEAIKSALAAGQTVEVELTAGPTTWGFVRLWDIRDRVNPVQIGTFDTTATHQFPTPRSGWFAAHHPFVRGDRLYVSWWADGVRVVNIADPTHPKEIGHFVPPFEPGTPDYSDFWVTAGKHAVVWAAIEHHGLILLSDSQSGLWILRDLPR